MPNASVTRCSWAPTGGAAVSLLRISEPNISKDQHGESEVLFGLAKEGYGFRDDVRPSYTITFNTPVLDGTPEYDWERAAINKTEGTFTRSVGISTAMYEGKVVSAEESVDAMRSTTLAVTILARTKRLV